MLHIKQEHINHCIASILVKRLVTMMSTSRQMFSLKLLKHIYQPQVYNTLLAWFKCQKETPVWGKNKLMVKTDKQQTVYQLCISSCGCCICLQMCWCREGVTHAEPSWQRADILWECSEHCLYMTVCRMWVKASNTLEGCEVSIQLTQNYAVGDCVIILLSHPPPKKKKKNLASSARWRKAVLLMKYLMPIGRSFYK